MSNQNNELASPKAQLTRRSALKIGLGTSVAVTLFGMGARIVMAQEGQVLKVANPAFNQDWSPLRGGGVPFRWNSAWWASPMYFDAKGDLHPYVFTSWEPSDDNKTWTFKIDPKAVFSDGSKITAEDVKGSWNVASMPNTKSQRADQVLSKVAGFAEVSGGTAKEISGVATPDEGTVVVTLAASDPIFHMRIANHIAPITKAAQSRGEDGEEVTDWYMPANGAVYSGPFKLTSIDLDGGKLVFEANENFFGPKPKLARIEISSIEDNVTATSLLKSGEFNAHTELVTSTIIQDLGRRICIRSADPDQPAFLVQQQARADGRSEGPPGADHGCRSRWADQGLFPGWPAQEDRPGHQLRAGCRKFRLRTLPL